MRRRWFGVFSCAALVCACKGEPQVSYDTSTDATGLTIVTASCTGADETACGTAISARVATECPNVPRDRIKRGGGDDKTFRETWTCRLKDLR
jgi:hypothetical protein